MRSKLFLMLFVVSAIAACNSPELSGTVHVDGSSTVLPLSAAMADAFRKDHPNVTISNQFSGTGGGFKKFCAGQTDINAASRPINVVEAEQCKTQKVDHNRRAILTRLGVKSKTKIDHPATPCTAYRPCG